MEFDGFIGLWLSAALTIRRRRFRSVTFVQIFVCRRSFLYKCLRLKIFFPSLTRCAQSLEKEVQDVKTTLQSMLAQLREEEKEEEEEEEEEALQDDDLMQNGTEEEEEEEEDQYFSDSWDI